MNIFKIKSKSGVKCLRDLILLFTGWIFPADNTDNGFFDVNLLCLYWLKQLINEPTHVTESSSTLTDLICTNYTYRIGCSGVSHIAISDHSLVYVYWKISSICNRNFRNFDPENFRNEVSQQDWSFNESEDPNLVWSNWKTKFLRVVNSLAPKSN